MQTEYVIALLITWVLFVVLQSFVHFYIIEVQKTKPIYLQWNIIRGMVSIFHGIAFDVSRMQEFLPVLVFQLIIHFIVFAPLLNKLRRPLNPFSTFWYLGADSGYTDRLLKHLPFNAYKGLYYLACVLLLPSIWWVLRGFAG